LDALGIFGWVATTICLWDSVLLTISGNYTVAGILAMFEVCWIDPKNHMPALPIV